MPRAIATQVRAQTRARVRSRRRAHLLQRVLASPEVVLRDLAGVPLAAQDFEVGHDLRTVSAPAPAQTRD